MEDMVSLDSNCLTFLLEALEGIAKPTDALADQKIALVRLFFHGAPLLTTPTVRSEAEQISDPARQAKHQSWMMTHFGTVPIRVPANQIAQRAKHFRQWHRKPKDCTVLAEAEAAQFAILLSYDDRFVRRLAGKANVQLMKPLAYWESLKIPKGSKPRWVPDQPNPLVTQNWWHW